MARQSKTYAMLTSEHRFPIQEEIRPRRAAHIIVGLPSDSPELEEKNEKKEEEGHQPIPMEMVNPEEYVGPPEEYTGPPEEDSAE